MMTEERIMITDLLKTETAASHAGLEKLYLGHLNKVNNTDSYAGFLKIKAEFILPLEDAIFKQHVFDIVPDAGKRRRSLYLVNDCIEAGVMLEDLQFTTNPFEYIDDAFSATGALYVLEGSTLGGNIIGNRLLPARGITSALSYFLHSGENLTDNWLKFRQSLNTNIPANKTAKVIAAAQTTFSAYAAWLNQH